MPQVRKSPEQVLLENRINKTRKLLSHMASQLRSLRARNKATRERERRQRKVDKESSHVEESFNSLMGEVKQEAKRIAEIKKEAVEKLANEGINDDLKSESFEEDLMAALDEVNEEKQIEGADPSAGSSKDKVRKL